MNRPEVVATYDSDFFAWTQAQAEALRGLPAPRAGSCADIERIDMGPVDMGPVDVAHIDLEHLAEKIGDLGKRGLREVKSLLSRALGHLIEIALDMRGQAAPHWRTEALVFQRDAFNGFSPSMRHHLDMADLWRQGRRFAAASLDRDEASLPVPVACPFSLEELVADRFDLEGALGRLA